MVRSLQARLVGLFVVLSLVFGGLFPSLAEAQSSTCPATAYSGGAVSAGTRVRIVGLSDSDAYYSSWSGIVGKTGTVDQLDPTGGAACWHGGQFYGDDGSSFYFYQVAVELIGAGSVAGTACPGGAITYGTTEGTRVKILGIHPDDAYYSSAATLIGQMGKVSGDLHSNDGCWMGGGFTADDGAYYYFYKAAVMSMGAPPAEAPGVACPGGSATAGMTEGTRVKILGIHPDDAYFSSAATLIGQSGKVSGDLHSNDGCWMGGGFTADDGSYYYFYKAAVQNLGGSTVVASGSCPAGSYTGAVPTNGTRVRIITVSPSDAYYTSRYDYGLEGKVGRVGDNLWSKTSEPCWFAGQFYGDDGSSYYFYQAALEVLGSGGASTGKAGDRYMGSAVSSGTRFRVVAIHPDDAYYSTRATLIGKHCTATDAMASQGSGWYSGSVSCSDATEYYFFKVGIVLE